MLAQLDPLVPSVRRMFDACLYNRGRVHEARGQDGPARSAYARSIRYRANATVLARWRTVARDGEDAPIHLPGSAWRFETERRREVCGAEGPVELNDEDRRIAEVTESCGAEVYDLAVDDSGHCALVIGTWSDRNYRYTEDSDPLLATTSLAVLQGHR